MANIQEHPQSGKVTGSEARELLIRYSMFYGKNITVKVGKERTSTVSPLRLQGV